MTERLEERVCVKNKARPPANDVLTHPLQQMLNPNVAYHPIIGVVLLALVAVQPLLGFLHHRRYRRTQRRGAVSHLHLWNGRVLIALGIVNGGLGLHVSGAPSAAKVGYAIVAAVLGGGWLVTGLVCWGGARGRRDDGSPRGKAGGYSF